MPIGAFEFATAGRVIFGRGRLKDAPAAVRELGQRVFVVMGADPRRAERLLGMLSASGIATVAHSVSGEPTVAVALEGAAKARAAACDVVVGIGGGSVLDAAKAMAALATNPGDPLDFLEVIGRAQPLQAEPLPVVAIPTTAGTGSEVTRNAVLGSPEHRVKVSLRSPRMLPRVAIVDPELTVALPPALTAATGLDALTQLIEPFLSCRANPLTDGLCREGVQRVARSLVRACGDGADLDAREDLCCASLFGGLALANAGLGAVHGFAGPMGGMYPIPHGALCAALLAPTLAANLKALRERAPQSQALTRFSELGVLLTGKTNAGPDDAIDWVRKLCRRLGIPALDQLGVPVTDHPAIVAKAIQASSMKANPLPLTSDELTGILAAA